MALVAERLVPGSGAPSAVLLGAGTLLLPFATLFFDHLLSAALGFAAFAVLFHARERVRAGPLLVVAGALAGLAVVCEFPLGIVAVVLAAYGAAGERPARRALVYTGGFAAGLLPLLAFNTWAFGSPWTLGYTNALVAPSGGGDAPLVGANDDGFYGVGLPDPRAALTLLVSEKGLLIVAPLAIIALAGLPLAWRAGRRPEALVCGGIPLLFLLYNAAYYLPFGGQGPGPRFLVPALPFLVVPLAYLVRARPVLATGIGLVSTAVMALATIAGPLTGVEYGIGTWLDRAGRSELEATLATRLGIGDPWAAALPFLVLLAIALVLGLARLPLRARMRADGPLLAVLLAGWVLVVLAGAGPAPRRRRARHASRERGP